MELEEECPFLRLPEDVLFHISKFLKPNDLIALLKVGRCSKLSLLASGNSFFFFSSFG